MAKSNRQRAERRGRRAELLAALLLRTKGYSIVARRARTPMGEIDIIARRKYDLVFVEVKARKDFATGINAITPAQRRRISKAAAFWIANDKSANNLNCRFDIILVRPYLSVRHIKNAFGEGGKQF